MMKNTGFLEGEFCLYRGVFWIIDEANGVPIVLARKFSCDKNGVPTERGTELSSENANDLNHRVEWSRIQSNVTHGKPFNYYPRGRVQIRHGKAVIFLNPDICYEAVIAQVKRQFGLDSPELACVRVVADGSEHYSYTKGKWEPNGE